MKRTLANVLVVVALASGVVLLAMTTGLFPAQQPEPTEAVPLVKTEPAAIVKRASAPGAPMAAPSARAFPVCPAPAEGARMHVGHASASASVQSLFVWCRGGYGLFSLDLAGPVLLTQLAHLPTKMPRPGGAVVADITADGMADLVVGVAPKEGVVHAPGSGVFLARGRAQGGYEPAFPLLEMPIVGLELVPARAQPASPELFVLTRGDAAARRPGQLVWFESGATPLKKGASDTGLLPRDLRVAQLGEKAALELLMLAAEPARVLALSPAKPPTETTREVILEQGAALCTASDPRFVLARTTHDLFRVSDEPLALTLWFRGANVGPCATGDLDRDGEPDALAVTDAGVIWLRDGGDNSGESSAHELTLPAGYRALDVAYAAGEAARVIALALDVEHGQLVLLVWPALPWEAGTLVLAEQAARDSAAVAQIPLE